MDKGREDKDLAALAALPQAKAVQGWYLPWLRFMEERVDFAYKESRLHTKLHCGRVMLYALLMGQAQGLAGEEMEVLAQAAAFHDTRRRDDSLDTGHGDRAAAYYAQYCKDHGDIRYDPRTEGIMAYHDRDDRLGILALARLEAEHPHSRLLYRIFKDADGLDRLRLGEWALDVNMLRTGEALALLDFARSLCGGGSKAEDLV